MTKKIVPNSQKERIVFDDFNESKSKVAILIDAENISHKNAKQIMDIMSEKGDIIICEIIADWSNSKSAGWKKESSTYSMTIFQQSSYTARKNTNDIAMTIRTMQMLYEKPFIDVFCLVSSDSDFTRLAQELKGQNKQVVGMGEREKSIPEFVNAFTEFVYLGEELNLDKEVADVSENESKAAEVKKEKLEKPLPSKQFNALKILIEELVDDYDGVAEYSLITNGMKKQFSDFVPTNYDCKNMRKLIEKLLPFLPDYEVYEEKSKNDPNAKRMMLKKK